MRSSIPGTDPRDLSLPRLPGQCPGLIAALGLYLVLGVSPLCADDNGAPPAPDSGADAEMTVETPDAEQRRGKDRPKDGKSDDVIFDSVTVIGSAERAERIPGSAHLIDRKRLELFRYADIHRVLRQIPGVVIQEEDGFGLRPNIGLRGTGVERSQKITLLEDGVPAAPAPYAAPAAYYSPTAGRMAGFEVRKGSASIIQGPLTNGGVLNYLSTTVPDELDIRLDLTGGDHASGKLRGSVGMSGDRFGFLLETFQHTTDGFKNLDGGGDTGFTLEDYLGKLRFVTRTGTRARHEVELTVGRTEQQGEETYLGLTDADFELTPYRRYLGSASDRIDTEHDALSLRWAVSPSDHLDVVTTLYRRDFFRNWYKNESTLGVSNRSVLADPATYADALAVLRGEVDSADDAVKLRHNRRDYYSQGLQTTATWNLVGDHTVHRLQVGFRVHEDEEDRLQHDDGWAVRGGALVRTSLGAPGSQANRVARAEAVAVFVQDEVTFGDLTLSPGLRFESIDPARLASARPDPLRPGPDPSRRENSFDAWLPGLGVAWSASSKWTVIGGVHRGFSPPSPSSTREVEAEQSLHYEAGIRFTDGDRGAELIGFFSDYQNLLGSDTLSGGGTGSGDQFNGGEVDIYGIEASLSGVLVRTATFSLPVRLAYTMSRGEFRSDFETSFADWSPEVRRGDRLPYLPEHQLYAEVGLEYGPLEAYLNASWVDEVRTTAGAGPIADVERIEDHLVFDLSASWRLGERFGLVLDVRNLTDEVYAVARRPYGLRPGLPRTTTGGLSIRF